TSPARRGTPRRRGGAGRRSRPRSRTPAPARSRSCRRCGRSGDRDLGCRGRRRPWRPRSGADPTAARGAASARRIVGRRAARLYLAPFLTSGSPKSLSEERSQKIKAIQEHIWNKYVEGEHVDFDETAALAELEAFHRDTPVAQAPDTYYLGILYFEMA